MSTTFEVIAYISSQKGSFSSNANEFSMGDMVCMVGKFCYDIIAGETTGIVVTISKVIKYPNKNFSSWAINNYPKTRPFISFSAVCESAVKNGISQVNPSFADKYEGNEIKYVSMRTTLYGCLSRTSDIPHYFLVVYAHKLLWWTNLKFQLNRRYIISGILDSFLEQENSTTSLVIRATDIDFDLHSNSNSVSISVPNQHGTINETSETPGLTDFLKFQTTKRKDEISSTTFKSPYTNKKEKKSINEDEILQPKSQIIAHSSFQNLPQKNKFYASYQESPQLLTSQLITPQFSFLDSIPNQSSLHETPSNSVQETLEPKKSNINDLATLALENNTDNSINNSLTREMSGIEEINEEELSE
ncbi:4764_t:CDS:2 [Diversispora eburnea]|uniref:4764_t:CDS:1 n=1 Tax=Diversispora eburnea TaxID=1213867 RepID=A0A9N9FDB1_9GLOM|nr:4764_t:CDS:2 [Diversispora eburnea]